MTAEKRAQTQWPTENIVDLNFNDTKISDPCDFQT